MTDSQMNDSLAPSPQGEGWGGVSPAQDEDGQSGIDSAETPRQRLRLTYAKGEAVKFIAHQDEFRMWERAVRRANLPLLYKKGFNPQPHMQFASPLGVGFTGAAEPIDLILSPPVPPDEVAAALRAKLPPGVTLVNIEELPLKTPSLQSLLIGADYTIVLYADPGELRPDDLQARIDALLAQTEVVRERQRKGSHYHYNLRPLIFELRYMGYDPAREEHHIFLRVQQRAGATGRPDEVVDALDLDDFARTLRRDRLYFEDSAADVAIFVAYSIIDQATVARPSPQQPRKDRRAEQSDVVSARRPSGRSISERAADEFV